MRTGTVCLSFLSFKIWPKSGRAKHLMASCFSKNVAEWENYHGVNLLQKMYNTNESRWKARFQEKAILDIRKQDFDMRNDLRPGISLQERDLTSIKYVFLPQMKSQLRPVDYELLREQVEFGLRENEISLKKKRVFLYQDIGVCYDRMMKRGREAEKNISFADFKDMCNNMRKLEDTSDTIILLCAELSKSQVAEALMHLMKEVRV